MSTGPATLQTPDPNPEQSSSPAATPALSSSPGYEPPTVVQAGTELEFNQDLLDVMLAGEGNYTIQLTGNITAGSDLGGYLTLPTSVLTIPAPAELLAITLNPNVSLTIDGGGNSLNGAGLYRGLMVLGGAVTIENLAASSCSRAGRCWAAQSLAARPVAILVTAMETVSSWREAGR